MGREYPLTHVQQVHIVLRIDEPQNVRERRARTVEQYGQTRPHERVHIGREVLLQKLLDDFNRIVHQDRNRFVVPFRVRYVEWVEDRRVLPSDAGRDVDEPPAVRQLRPPRHLPRQIPVRVDEHQGGAGVAREVVEYPPLDELRLPGARTPDYVAVPLAVMLRHRERPVLFKKKARKRLVFFTKKFDVTRRIRRK